MPGRFAPGSPLRTFLGNAVIVVPLLLLAWFILWKFDSPQPERAVSNQNRAITEAQAASEHQRTQRLCQQQALCRRFGEARQACATAGDYKNCVDIKMGNEAM